MSRCSSSRVHPVEAWTQEVEMQGSFSPFAANNTSYDAVVHLHPANESIGAKEATLIKQGSLASNPSMPFRAQDALLQDVVEQDAKHQQAASSPGKTWRPIFSGFQFAILPHNPLYVRWFIVTMTVSLLASVFDPYNLAFVETAGWHPFYNFWAVTDYVATLVFVVDIALKFFLSYKDEQNRCFVTDTNAITLKYMKFHFWVDLAISLPIEPIVAGAMGLTVRDTRTARFVALLRWLRVGRLYRIFSVFGEIQHKHILSPLVLTLVRNYVYLFYIVHWIACILYFLANVNDFSEITWMGRDRAIERLDNLQGWADYLYSFYFSVGVFTGYSSEIFFKHSPSESIVLCVYFVINVVAQAYILGTITLLLVKKDVESGEYRNAVVTLDTYVHEKKLPKSLGAAMHEHLELQSYSEKTADEHILKFYPSTIKQKVLRHLYLDVLRDCYLFAGCTPQFLNQVLSTVRMELFMPNVPISQEGDTASELVIIVDGSVSVAPPSAQNTHGLWPDRGMSSDGRNSIGMSLDGRPSFGPDGRPSLGQYDMSPDTSKHGATPTNTTYMPSPKGMTRFGAEAASLDLDNSKTGGRAFFLDPSSSSVCDTAYGGGASVHKGLQPGNTHAQLTLDSTTPFGGGTPNDSVHKGQQTSTPRVKRVSTLGAITSYGGGDNWLGDTARQRSKEEGSFSMQRLPLGDTGPQQSPREGTCLLKGEAGGGSQRLWDSIFGSKENSLHGRQSDASFDVLRSQSFAQARGVAETLGTSDPVGEVPFFAEETYDCSAWTSSVTRVLIINHGAFEKLSERCPKDVGQVLRNLTRRSEKKLKEHTRQAISGGQLARLPGDMLMRITEGESFSVMQPTLLSDVKGLLTSTQLMALKRVETARRLLKENKEKHELLRMYAYLNAASNGDVQRLPALVGRGKEVSATDYDRRSALMLAARENKVEAVELLLKAGHETDTVDSFGYTALFEAVRMGNDGCIDLMLQYGAKLGVEPRITAPYIFSAIKKKDLKCLRRFIRVGADVDCTDLEGRTPLFLAAAEGLMEVVVLLVEEGNANVAAVDSWGHTPERDAAQAGHHAVAEYLREQVKGTDKWPLLAQGSDPLVSVSQIGLIHESQTIPEEAPFTGDLEAGPLLPGSSAVGVSPHPECRPPSSSAPLLSDAVFGGSKPGTSEPPSKPASPADYTNSKRQELRQALRRTVRSPSPGGSRLGTPSNPGRGRHTFSGAAPRLEPSGVNLAGLTCPSLSLQRHGPDRSNSGVPESARTVGTQQTLSVRDCALEFPEGSSLRVSDQSVRPQSGHAYGGGNNGLQTVDESAFRRISSLSSSSSSRSSSRTSSGRGFDQEIWPSEGDERS